MENALRQPLFERTRPVLRPRLARWLWDRNIDLRQAAEAFSVHPETVRCWSLPFEDPDFRVPRGQAMARIVAETNGEVTPADFYPPELTAPEGAAQQDRWAG